jgi:hypothetical protein
LGGGGWVRSRVGRVHELWMVWGEGGSQLGAVGVGDRGCTRSGWFGKRVGVGWEQLGWVRSRVGREHEVWLIEWPTTSFASRAGLPRHQMEMLMVALESP